MKIKIYHKVINMFFCIHTGAYVFCIVWFCLYSNLNFKKNILKRDLRAHKRKGKKRPPPLFWPFGLAAHPAAQRSSPSLSPRWATDAPSLLVSDSTPPSFFLPLPFLSPPQRASRARQWEIHPPSSRFFSFFGVPRCYKSRQELATPLFWS
jgi:hypothetical protein